MSAGYTEGLLAVSEQSGHILKRVDEFGPTTELIGSTMGGNADADARRLAACWNAFDGITTSDIEMLLSDGGVTGAFRTYIKGAIADDKEILKLRGEIVAALTLLNDVAERGFCSEHNLIRIRAFLAGEAA